MKKQGNNMKKQDAIEKSMNEYQRNEKIKKNQEEKELRNKLKPNLLKRFGSILVDGVLILVVFFGLFFLSYLTILKNGSFQDDMETMLSMKEESHLYKSINGSFVLISDDYDDTLTPEENYDEAITYFYSNIDYCIQENKLEIYNNAKINSKIFTLD
jgi:hypothetical protein